MFEVLLCEIVHYISLKLRFIKSISMESREPFSRFGACVKFSYSYYHYNASSCGEEYKGLEIQESPSGAEVAQKLSFERI